MFDIYEFFEDFYGITSFTDANGGISADVIIAIALTVIFCEFVIRISETIFKGGSAIFRR